MTKKVKDKILQISSESDGVTIENENSKKIDLLEEKLENLNAQQLSNYISVLGLFASVVTFLLVEIQILQKACSFDQLLGLSLIIFSLLSGFNLLIFLVNNRGNRPIIMFISTVIIFIVIAFSLGIFFANNGINDNCELNLINEKIDVNFEKYNNEIGELQKESKSQSEQILELKIKNELDTNP